MKQKIINWLVIVSLIISNANVIFLGTKPEMWQEIIFMLGAIFFSIERIVFFSKVYHIYDMFLLYALGRGGFYKIIEAIHQKELNTPTVVILVIIAVRLLSVYGSRIKFLSDLSDAIDNFFQKQATKYEMKKKTQHLRPGLPLISKFSENQVMIFIGILCLLGILGVFL